MSSQKLCRDCKWAERSTRGMLWWKTEYVSVAALCKNFATVGGQRVFEPVNGKDCTQFSMCDTNRKPNGPCGREAKLFEPRAA